MTFKRVFYLIFKYCICGRISNENYKKIVNVTAFFDAVQIREQHSDRL